MAKIKIFIAEGNEEYYKRMSSVEIVDSISKSDVVIFSTDRYPCVEYSELCGKDSYLKYKKFVENNHEFDPIKDYRLFNIYKDLHRQRIEKHIVYVGRAVNHGTFFDASKFSILTQINDNFIYCGVSEKMGDILCQSGGRFYITISEDEFFSNEYFTLLFENLFLSKSQSTRGDALYTNFQYMNDCSYYSAEEANGKFYYDFDIRPCFGAVIKRAIPENFKENQDVSVKYKVRICKPSSWNISLGRCVTFFKKEEYEKYYQKIHELYPFEYSIDESDKYVTLNINITGKRIHHLMILTMLRFIYQYPMHYILHDSLKLWGMKEYSDMNIFDILNVVSFSLQGIVNEDNEYMPYAYKLYDFGYILKHFGKEAFEKKVDECVNQKNCSFNGIMGKLTTPIKREDFNFIKNCLMTTNWNVFTNTFDHRIDTYKKNIEIFNKKIE